MSLSYKTTAVIVVLVGIVFSAEHFQTYNPGILKPIDSAQKIFADSTAPNFLLKSLSGEYIDLQMFFGKKNVVISFVPAAWTPICSDQWPGYNMVYDSIEAFGAVLLGITVDNLPTLWAWTKNMTPDGAPLAFSVLSDFYPHGAVAERFGVLRTDGMSERAIFVIDRHGIVRFARVYDINARPPIDDVFNILRALQ